MKNSENRITNSIANKQFRSVMITLITVELANAVACMVDGFTIGHFMGNETIAAFGIAAPYFSLTAIISGILMVSLQVIVSKSLGKGDVQKANEAFNTILVIGIVVGVLVSVLGFVFSKQVAMLFGAKGDSIGLCQLTSEALKGYFLGTTFNILFCLLTPILQLDGRQKLVNAGGIISAVSDIIFDLLNVFVFKWGIFGISLATTFSYLIPALVFCTYFTRKEKTFTVSKSAINMKNSFAYVREGLPRGIGMLARLLGPIFMNIIVLATAATVGMAAMSVLGSIKFLIMAPGWGIAGAVLMLTGVAVGEKDKNNITGVIKNSIKYNVLIVCVLAAILEVVALPIAKAFVTDSDEVVKMAVHAIRWYAAALPVIALNQVVMNYLQAIGKKIGTYVYNIANEFVAYVAVLFVMAKVFGIEGIWAAMLVEQILLLVVYVVIAIIKQPKAKGFDKILFLDESFDADMEDFVETSLTTNEEVCQLSEKVMKLCEEHNIEFRKSYYLGLCLEELANNVLQHGFSDGKPHKLEVRVVVDDGDVVLRMRDDCKAFDLNKYFAMHRMDEASAEKGIGLKLVMKSAKQVNYSYTLNTNYIIVIL